MTVFAQSLILLPKVDFFEPDASAQSPETSKTPNLTNHLSPSSEKLNTSHANQQHSMPSTPISASNLLNHLPKKTVLRPKVRVVEHTVFLADDTNQPFRVKAKNQSYCERVTNTKLNSQRKLKYVCNDNLADRITSKNSNSTSVSLIHKDKNYQKNASETETHDASKYMPEKYNVDAFILTIDASEAKNYKNHTSNNRRMSGGVGGFEESRYESQLAFLDEIIPFLVHSRKPVVVTFTQRDKIEEKDLANFVEFRRLVECKVLGKKLTKNKTTNPDLVQNSQSSSQLNPNNNNSITPSASNGSLDIQSALNNQHNQHNQQTPTKKRDKPIGKYNWSITPTFIDTSSELQANCDVPFISASHMVLKKSYTPTTYEEAFEKIESKRKSAKLAWKKLIENKVSSYTDYERYSTFQQQVQDSVEYKTMIDIFGKNSVLLAKGFRDHVTELRQLFKETRQQGYMWYFPQALHVLLPDLSYIEDVGEVDEDRTISLEIKNLKQFLFYFYVRFF